MKWILGLLGTGGVATVAAAGIDSYGDFKIAKMAGDYLVQFPGYFIIFGVLVSMVFTTRYLHKSSDYNFKFDYRSIATMAMMVVYVFVLVIAILILHKQDLI